MEGRSALRLLLLAVALSARGGAHAVRVQAHTLGLAAEATAGPHHRHHRHRHRYHDRHVAAPSRDELVEALRLDTCSMTVGEEHKSCLFVSQNVCSGLARGTPAPSKAAECIRPRGSCALVGSSANLLGSGLGAEIDSHEVVIRMNGAISGSNIKSLGTDVGSRTTIRMVNGLGAYPRSDVLEKVCHIHNEVPISNNCGYRCGMHPALCNRKCDIRNQHVSKLKCAFRAPLPTSKPHWPMVLDHADGFIADTVLGLAEFNANRSTAGFTAFVFALRTCARVTVFGFGPSCDGRVGERYYTGARSMQDVSKVHDYDDEFEMIRNISGFNDDKFDSPLKGYRWLRAGEVTMRLPKCLVKKTKKKWRSGPKSAWYEPWKETQTVRLAESTLQKMPMEA